MSDDSKTMGVSKANWDNAAENNFEGLVFTKTDNTMLIGAAEGDDSLKEYSSMYEAAD